MFLVKKNCLGPKQGVKVPFSDILARRQKLVF